MSLLIDNFSRHSRETPKPPTAIFVIVTENLWQQVEGYGKKIARATAAISPLKIPGLGLLRIGSSKKDKPKTDSEKLGEDSGLRDKDGSASSRFDKMAGRKDFSEGRGLSSDRKAKYTPRDNPLSIMLGMEQADDVIEKPMLDLAGKIAGCKEDHPGLGGRPSQTPINVNEIIEDHSLSDSGPTPA